MPLVTLPDHSTTDVPDTQVAALAATFARAGDAETEDGWLYLSDLMHDIADHCGAQAANDADSEADAEAALDEASEAASEVSNAGTEAMLAWLIAFHGFEAAETLIQAAPTTTPPGTPATQG